MIDRETVDRIYAAANIVDIVGDFVTLKRKGVNYQACCPFHNEKTPSFVVSPSKGVYKCFGCGKGGNAVTFLMEHENVTYPEALKMVAKRYGIEVKEKELTPEEERRNNDRESMFALNGWAADYFADYLHHESEGMSVGMAYFRQTRGMTDATIQKFGLGFCPAKGDKMSKDALAAGYKEEFLLSTGLSLKRESDGSLFDRFHDRVMFPVHNISGRIVAFGGRTLRTDKKVAKYQNSPESEIYSKKRELYGLYFAKKAIQQQDFAIMVEGYTDVISMHQAGVENVVASSGTSLTTEQIRLLNRFTKNITVIYDGDSAGIHASLRGIDMILKEGMNVRVVLLPEPEDPDSFARSHTAAELQEYIRTNEQDFLAFKAKLLLEDAQGDPIKKASLIGDMVQSVAQIPDSIQRAVYIKECARIMEIDEQILISEVARKRLSTTGDRETDEFVRRQTTLRRETPREPEVEYVREVEAGSSTDALERELCKYLLKYGHCSFDFKEGRTMVACNVAEVIFDELADGGLTFRNPQYDKIRAAYCEQWQQSGVGVEVPAHLFTNHSDPEVCNVSVDLLFSDDNYVPSELWKRKDVHVESDAEMLAVGVPKAVALYKTKVIEGLIKECQAKLGDELTDEQVTEIMQRLAALNRAKVTMARKLQRLIL
ncbi:MULTISPECIES: DNA primase [Alistipes]|jgi:DNA primase|uniref:DNA primase n=1 Tax=Alistipes TaxID=239759 RepID=UPI00203BA013|nr:MULTISPECIES: DNA primase [Alistipes]MCX4282578.1 DNA primase [Alistipes sp.]HUN15033.1 DNA primase [Alistipes sp.]